MSAATTLAGSAAHAAPPEGAAVETPATAVLTESDESAADTQNLSGSINTDANLDATAAVAQEDPAVAAMKQNATGDGGETNAGIGKTPSLKGFHAEVTNWAFGPGHVDIQTNFAALEEQLIHAKVLPILAFEEPSRPAVNVALPQDRVGAHQLLAHYGNRYKEMKQDGIPKIQMV